MKPDFFEELMGRIGKKGLILILILLVLSDVVGGFVIQNMQEKKREKATQSLISDIKGDEETKELIQNAGKKVSAVVEEVEESGMSKTLKDDAVSVYQSLSEENAPLEEEERVGADVSGKKVDINEQKEKKKTDTEKTVSENKSVTKEAQP